MQIMVGPVVCHGNAAVPALLDFTTFRTKHGGIKPPAVEKQNTLFPVLIALPQGFNQLLGKNRGRLLFQGFPSHIHQMYQGEFPTIDPLAEYRLLVFFTLYITGGFQGRSGGSKKQTP